jgi:DNA polymerase-3 subunit delta'
LNIIYISNDIEKAKEEIISKYKNIYIFEDIDLKLELVKSIKEEAYQTTEKDKYILIKAVNFRIESQNALLKILEETPDKVNFIILTTSKYALLDTIKSRMSIKTINYNLAKIEFNLNINRLTTKDIYETLKKPLDKQELKSFIYEIFKNIQNPNKELLEDFELAIKLVDLNTDKQAIISLLLLSIRNLNANLQTFK